MNRSLIASLFAAIAFVSSGHAQEDGPKIDWAKVDCRAPPRSHNEADLCEQRRMAKAAEEAVQLSWWQLIVGTAGFGFVIWNLWYVRRSTVAAISAAQAAETAVGVSSETAKRQLRAYLFTQKAKAENVNSGLTPTGSFSLTNGGATPAYDVRLRIEMVIGKDDAIREVTIGSASRGVIGPGQSTSPRVTLGRPLSPDEMNDINDGTRRLFFHGKIEYRDAFGDERQIKFKFRLARRATDYSWVAHANGNESN